VNHKQTYRQETDGGYIWSPKANANGARNVTYDNLSRCQRGDVVFSYANGRISQLGLVETSAITATKPPEFGSAGENWSQEGWLVRVNWQPLRQALVARCQLRRRLASITLAGSPAASPCHGRGRRQRKLSHPGRHETWSALPCSPAMETRRASDRHQATTRLDGSAPDLLSPLSRGAHEPSDPTVRRQRGAHHRHLAPGSGWRLAGN
jgi:hypothetical protein